MISLQNSNKGCPAFISAITQSFSLAAPRKWLLDFNPAHQRVVFHGGELDHILTAGICVHHELLDDCLVLGASGSEDIEIGQHLRAVDAHVEYSRPGG